MSKNKNEVPTAKVRKVYEKSRGEHYKDIVIAILVTAVIAFIGGMAFANRQNAEVEQAVKAAQVTTPVANAQASK